MQVDRILILVISNSANMVAGGSTHLSALLLKKQQFYASDLLGWAKCNMTLFLLDLELSAGCYSNSLMCLLRSKSFWKELK